MNNLMHKICITCVLLDKWMWQTSLYIHSMRLMGTDVTVCTAQMENAHFKPQVTQSSSSEHRETPEHFSAVEGLYLNILWHAWYMTDWTWTGHTAADVLHNANATMFSADVCTGGTIVYRLAVYLNVCLCFDILISTLYIGKMGFRQFSSIVF